tara:strand:- start:157 stop:363 length:207 start_codon:yes stop_codon:yes gene_type:complete
MMKLIRFNHAPTGHIWVNPDQIAYIIDSDGRQTTMLQFIVDEETYLEIDESCDKVIAKLMDADVDIFA